LVGYRLKNLEGIDEWKEIVVVLNGSRESRLVDVPEGEYEVACCDGVINEKSGEKIQGGQVSVEAQSALIIYRK